MLVIMLQHASIWKPSLALAEEIGSVRNIDACLLNLGGLLQLQGDYAGSKSYYRRGLENAQKYGIKSSSLLVHSGLVTSCL